MTANGLEGLAAIGARELATAAGFPTRRNVMWNEAGRRLASLPARLLGPGQPCGAHDEAIAAGARAPGRGDPARDPDRIRSAAQHGRGGCGRSRARHVRRRQHRFRRPAHRGGRRALRGPPGHRSCGPSGRYVGLTNFGGVTRGAAKGIEPEAWHLIFGRQAFFGYQATPDGDVVWFANVPRPPITPEERASTSEAAWRRQLANLFAGDAGPAVELIEAGELELAADNTHDLGHVPVWHRGPMIIIGDAAHAPAPTSGQGASMAIEDAIALAGELGTGVVDRGGVRRLRAASPRARREDRRVGRTRQQRQGAGTVRADRPRRDAADPLPVGDHREVPRLDVRLPDRTREATSRPCCRGARVGGHLASTVRADTLARDGTSGDRWRGARRRLTARDNSGTQRRVDDAACHVDQTVTAPK